MFYVFAFDQQTARELLPHRNVLTGTASIIILKPFQRRYFGSRFTNSL